MADPRENGSSLARHLLCAVPQLQDPNFRRAVVLMLEHESEGALGLVLNHELDTTMSDVANSVGMAWNGSPAQPVRCGGPVEPMRGWILHDREDWDPACRPVLPGIWLTTSLDPAREAGRDTLGGEQDHVLFLLGYAGWGSSQLEAEIAAGSWVAIPIREDDGDAVAGVSPTWVLDTPPEDMWDDALRAIGVDPARLVGLKGSGDLALH